MPVVTGTPKARAATLGAAIAEAYGKLEPRLAEEYRALAANKHGIDPAELLERVAAELLRSGLVVVRTGDDAAGDAEFYMARAEQVLAKAEGIAEYNAGPAATLTKVARGWREHAAITAGLDAMAAGAGELA